MVAACVAMLRAFRYDLATTPQFLKVSAPGELSTVSGGNGTNGGHRANGDNGRHDVSATLAGLVAVHRIDVDTVTVHETTGEVTVEEPVDPLADSEGDFEDDSVEQRSQS
ncbi:hypothetical protein MPOR_42190 [Mycolicibacterium poriferae]|uniref:Uncharacterized protein n=2 Tax=Mycobacteriaceae TaxID=1762 RepID=A0A6N4VGB1_9MYCO|nr:hypothetical protein MPOR_42190 [Mycolicibacterium poriferae]